MKDNLSLPLILYACIISTLKSAKAYLKGADEYAEGSQICLVQ